MKLDNNDGRTATFTDDDGRIATLSVDRLQSAYHVHSGSDVFANEDEFWLFEFGDKTVVFPDGADSLPDLLRAWRNAIEAVGGHEAVCAIPPLSWRRKILGILPTTQTKSMLLPPHALEVLENWKIIEPLSLDLYT